jgi:hypothetical protein
MAPPARATENTYQPHQFERPQNAAPPQNQNARPQERAPEPQPERNQPREQEQKKEPEKGRK